MKSCPGEGRLRGARRGRCGSPPQSPRRAARTRSSLPLRGPAQRRPRQTARRARRPLPPARRSASRPPRRPSRPRRPARPAPQRPAASRASSALRCARAWPKRWRRSPRLGQRAATKRSRCARRSPGGPLISASRSGEKTATGGRLRASVAGSAALPSSRWRRPSLRLTEASRRRLDAVVVSHRRFRPGEGAPEGDQVTAVGGAKRTAGEGEVERLEKVRLADPIGADEADDPGPQVDPRLRQAPQRPRFDGGDQHRQGLTR